MLRRDGYAHVARIFVFVPSLFNSVFDLRLLWT